MIESFFTAEASLYLEIFRSIFLELIAFIIGAFYLYFLVVRYRGLSEIESDTDTRESVVEFIVNRRPSNKVSRGEALLGRF